MSRSTNADTPSSDSHDCSRNTNSLSAPEWDRNRSSFCLPCRNRRSRSVRKKSLAVAAAGLLRSRCVQYDAVLVGLQGQLMRLAIEELQGQWISILLLRLMLVLPL